jgi:predicted O-linked N-acetylglucosamine transferase (SPINDLY family)/predicted SAM-dependent methyltransferase
MTRKLHIGGAAKSENWEILNINSEADVDHRIDAADLSKFADRTFTEIYASHVIEHFDYVDDKIIKVLKEWFRVLEDGGKLYISVPDIDELAKLLLLKEELNLQERFLIMRMMFGMHENKNDYKLIGLNEAFLSHFLNAAGFIRIRKVADFGIFQDASTFEFKGKHISLNMVAEKPESKTPQIVLNDQDRNAINKTAEEALMLQHQGKLADAERLFRVVNVADPSNFIALYSLGVILMNKGALLDALVCFETATKVKPNFEAAWYVYGSVLHAIGRYDEALSSFNRALELKPNYPEVLVNRGTLLHDMKRTYEALASLEQALELQPENQLLLNNYGIILALISRNEDAIKSFERLLTLNPAYEFALGSLCFAKLHCGSWDGYEQLTEQIIDGVRKRKPVSKSLAFMPISNSAKDQWACAKIYAENKCPPILPTIWNGERYLHEKIKIAYISPDLRQHPVAHLLVGVLEQHDKSNFEVIAISIGVDDQSQLRSRIKNACNQFIDARNKTASAIAEMLKALEIDIAVDLAGYTADSRTEIFSRRPVPIQVNYLGYPGSMGADYMDYIVADKYVIPEEDQKYYSEKVVYLPDSYLPTDSELKPAEHLPTKPEAGLPENGFVYCAFNQGYKITPQMFKVWMRLLHQTEGSVLWLTKVSEIMQNNLRNVAANMGVDSERLIFAERLTKVEDHLARFSLADIYLDTFPYNGHTTATDALKVGLPVITYMGQSFPSRVAGSLLQTMGLPELITNSWESYEAVALKLAKDSHYLAEIKAKLANNKQSSPLFNTSRYCKHLEAAYRIMYERYQKGEKSTNIQINN